jgi:molybdate-binding protein/DNA-binding transcriptional regulator YhcF (GntR family)
MEEPYLYQRIADSIRQQILNGKLKPGDRLPPVREMALRWDCTTGTIHQAYLKLAQQGLIVSRPGQGTKIVDDLQSILNAEAPLRRASLIHRAEAYLLEMLTAGYTLPDIEDALRQAMDRWRTVDREPTPSQANAVRFSGSHDLVITWLASHFSEIAPKQRLNLEFAGSLGGLIALAENRAEFAGSHLWDEESDTFNVPFIRRVLPGRRIALVTVAQRRLGLILPAGNPFHINGLEDLTRSSLRFVNRQRGSGTRVWLDAALSQLGIKTTDIQGYTTEKKTHSAVARAIAENEADAGIGLEAAARSYGLDFIFLRHDRYDLVIPDSSFSLPTISAIINWLKTEETHDLIANLGGYDGQETGRIQWVE